MLVASGVTLMIFSTYIAVHRRQLQDDFGGRGEGWLVSGTLKNLRNLERYDFLTFLLIRYIQILVMKKI